MEVIEESDVCDGEQACSDYSDEPASCCKSMLLNLVEWDCWNTIVVVQGLSNFFPDDPNFGHSTLQVHAFMFLFFLIVNFMLKYGNVFNKFWGGF